MIEALKAIPDAVVGGRVRRIRLQLGLSIRDLAERASVNKNSVVRLEQGRGTHTSTILKIAKALGVHLARFVSPVSESEADQRIHREPDDRWHDIDSFESGPVNESGSISISQLAKLHSAGKIKVPTNLLQSRVPGGRLWSTVIIPFEPSEVRSHAGEEFVYILSGQALITVGDQTTELSAGESMAFWSAEPHQYASVNPANPAVILSVRMDDLPAKAGPQKTTR